MQVEKIARLLPEIFQASLGENGPLDAFLQAQAALHAPIEAVLEDYPRYFDPRSAPLPFLYLLAHWVGLDYLLEGPKFAPHFPSGEGRLRELICVVALNARQRGSALGIERILEVATGIVGFSCSHDADETARCPFYVVVRAPAEAKKYQTLVEKIVEAEKPAFTQCEISFSSVSDGGAIELT